MLKKMLLVVAILALGAVPSAWAGDVLQKLDPATLSTQASFSLGFDSVVVHGLAPITNGNLAVLSSQSPTNGQANVHLVHAADFTRIVTTHIEGHPGSNYGGGGGACNPFGEVFMTKERSSGAGDGYTVNALDDALPVITNLVGGYFDPTHDVAALPDGAWVLAYGVDGALGAIELRTRDLMSRIARFSGFDVVTVVATNGLGHIAVCGYHSGINRSYIYIFHYAGGVLGDIVSAKGFTESAVQDIRAMSGSKWAVAMNTTTGGDVVVLEELNDPEIGFALVEAGRVSGLELLRSLDVQSDDDIVAASKTGTLYLYTGTLAPVTSRTGFGSITNVAVLKNTDAVVVTTPVVAVTVTGTIALADYSLADLSNVGATIDLNSTVAGGANRTMKVLLPASGAFSISNVDQGNYNLSVKTYAHLKKTVNVNVSPNPTDVGTVTLLSGDLDGNNGVDSTDLSIVLANADVAGN